MAGNFVTTNFFAAAIQVAVDKAASSEIVSRLWENSDPERLIGRLAILASSLRSDPEDAEKVKVLPDEVHEDLFDADDLIDEIHTESLRLKLHAAIEVRERKRRKIVDFFCTRFRSLRDGERMDKVKKILARLEEAAKMDFSQKNPRQNPSTSLRTKVYGRDTDREALMNMLLSDEQGNENVCVIPIVGMVGIGKTAFAQSVFNDEDIRELFQLRAWACITPEYDPLRVTKEIFNQVSQLACDDAMDLNSVQVKLHECLFGKKFLIVLDDAWNENYLDWFELKKPFVDGAQGSKIIVTTRNTSIAGVMGTVRSYVLKKLADEASWLVFSKHASEVKDFTADPDLRRIGGELVRRCQGLPLPMVLLGGLLRSADVREWERVSNSDIWTLTKEAIRPIFGTSYHYLPSHLRQCFAYCSIFPKGYEFDKEELILLWMAENLLQDPNGNTRMEDLGGQYFDQLVSRSFLQSRNIDGTSFVMDDLMVDFAKCVSTNCRSLDSNCRSEARQVRYLSYISYMHNGNEERFDLVSAATRLRTFLTLKGSGCELSKETLDDLFSKLSCLRVLSFYGYRNIKEVPDSVGNLRHLRYLDLSDTSITYLPDTIITLYNLQTLKLARCNLLRELPKDFHHLISLRYLDISSTRINRLPASLSSMPNLHTLKLSISQHRQIANIETIVRNSASRSTTLKIVVVEDANGG